LPDVVFFDKSAADIIADKFRNAKNNSIAGIQIVEDPDCDCDLYEKVYPVVYPVRQKNGSTQFKQIGKLTVYVSNQSAKLAQCYEACTRIGYQEAVLFYDTAKKELKTRMGKGISENIKSALKYVNFQNQTFSKQLGTNGSLLVDFVNKKTTSAEIKILNALVQGISWLVCVFISPGKLVGMIAGPLGAIIIEKCSLPERFWNSELNNYVFRDLVNKIDDVYPPKENLLKLLQLDEETINSVFSIAEGIVRSEEFKILAPSFIKKVLDSILNALKSFIRGINKQIVQQIDRFYDEKMAESNLKASYTAQIARIAGVVNGIVDFVAGLFVFMGIAGNEPFDFLLDFNMETIIELFNKIIRLVERIVNTNLFLALLSSLFTFLDNIKEIELPDINTDKLSYGFGFITVFIATCFIPVAEGAKASNLKKILSILPEGMLDNVAAAAGKAEVLAGKVKNKAIALLDDIINFVNKSYAELKKFFDDLFAKIKNWLLKAKNNLSGAGKVAKLGEKLNVSDYATSAKNSIKDAMTPDHIPSFAALKKNLENILGRDLDPTELTQLRNEGTSLLYETSLHQKFSRTYGFRNTAEQIADDALDLFKAAQKDMDALRTPLKNSGMRDADIEKAFELIHQMNRKKGLY